MTYTIFIHTERAGTLVFKGVKEYSEEGSFIKFRDERKDKVFLYPSIKAQIEVER